MSLPKIDLPLFVDTMPSNKKTFLYRPFTVKEEKILLIAQQSKELKQTLVSIKQVLNNCVSYEDGSVFDVSKIPVFDLEYIMLKIRSKAVNNKIELLIKDTETEKNVEVEVDIDSMTLKYYDNHTNKIKINDEYHLILKYPSIDVLYSLADQSLTEAEKSYNVMLNCLDKLVSEENVYDFSDETKESVAEFLDELSPKVISQMKVFFDTMPKLRHEIKYKNSLGNEKIVVIEGTETFFI